MSQAFSNGPVAPSPVVPVVSKSRRLCVRVFSQIFVNAAQHAVLHTLVHDVSSGVSWRHYPTGCRVGSHPISMLLQVTIIPVYR